MLTKAKVYAQAALPHARRPFNFQPAVRVILHPSVRLAFQRGRPFIFSARPSV